jgi:hypothetical protein
MYYEVTSDRDVFVDAIGLLKAGETVKVTDETSKLFQVLQNRTLGSANFPAFVKVTLVLDDSPTEG